MGYTKIQIIDALDELATNNIDKLYANKGAIWYEGYSSDTNEKYAEISANLIINKYLEQDGVDWLIKGISKDTRNNYFDTKRVNAIGKGEDKLQRDIYFNRNNEFDTIQKNYESFKEEVFIWFEFAGYPGKGKGIDLISYNKKNDRLSIYELKKYNNSKDTLLRAILEIQTYYQRTRFFKFATDWERYGIKNLGKNISIDKITTNNIRKVILIPENSLAYKNYADSSLVNVHKLLDLFKIEIVILR